MGGAGEVGGLGRQIAREVGALTLQKVAEVGLENARRNAASIERGKDVLALRDTPLGATEDALVIAAGPSLHRQDTARIIKESDFQGTLIVSESSMPWCLRHGIVPDLVVTLDPHPHRIVRWFGDPGLTEEMVERDDYFSRQDLDPKIREDQLRFNQELIDLIDKKGPEMRIAVASSASAQVVNRATEAGMDLYWWNPMYDDYENTDSLTREIHTMNGLPCLNAGGNVGSACWVLAHSVLRKKRVGLVGMDLGYHADTPYSQTQYYTEILDLVGPDRLDEVFIWISNPHLQQDFYTDPVYLWYRDAFLEMAQWAECDTHNCTGGGILFGPRITWSRLSDFLQHAEVDGPLMKETPADG